jgi:hypothetical protein
MATIKELQMYKNSKINELNNSFNKTINQYYSILKSNLNKIQNSKQTNNNKNIQKIILINEYNKSVNDLKVKLNKSISDVNNFFPPLIKITGKKRALLIGINYTNDKNNELYGCINDVKNIKNRLLTNGFNESDITVLTDFTELKPTKTNIINELTKLINATEDTDLSFFSISSHGSFIIDVNNDELDGYDEVIYTYDKLDITDDKLKTIILNLKKGATLFAFFDTCHSGTMLDLTYTYMDSNNYDNYTENKKNLETFGSVIAISGSTDAEISADTVFDDEARGAATNSLLESLKQKPECTWRELVINMRNYLKNNGFDQIPQFSCGKFEDIDTKVFI